MGSRSNWGIVARSEAEFNEIVDNLNEQEVRTVVQEMPNTVCCRGLLMRLGAQDLYE